MKQMDECLDRFFDGKTPLNKKWRAFLHAKYPNCLILTHYQHLVLIYNFKSDEIEYQWWEKPTDKRGLDAALKYLEKRKLKIGHLRPKKNY